MSYIDDFLKVAWPPERIKAWENYRDALENLGKKVFEHMQAKAAAEPQPCQLADERLKP